MPTVAQLHQEQKTEVLNVPLVAQATLPLLEANQGLHVIFPASCPAHCPSVSMGAEKSIWLPPALSILQGIPRLPQPMLVQPQAHPCHAQGCLSGAAGSALLHFQRILLGSRGT